MRARFWAAFLVLLIAVPFTAPFSTCDLATLLATPAPREAGHSLGASAIEATSLAPIVTMEEDDHACDLESPLDATETVTTVAVEDASVPTYLVVRTSPLPLRL